MNRDSDLYRLATIAANWLRYDQEVKRQCRECLGAGILTLDVPGLGTVQCAGYLLGEAKSRECYELLMGDVQR